MDKLYGFDDYTLISLRPGSFFPYNHIITNLTGWEMSNRLYNDYKCTYLPVNDEFIDNKESSYYSCISKECIPNHKELLDTAKTLYIHPSCKLSRGMVSQKYKKSLNPYIADAVIVPSPKNFNDREVSERSAIFINDAEKLIVLFINIDNTWDNEFKNAKSGTKIRDMVDPRMLMEYKRFIGQLSYDINAALDAELDFYGYIGRFNKNNQYIMDILTYNIPSSKLVYEKDVMASLGNESNTPTFENLTSIKEMLESTDIDTVSTAVKALATMDYIHYPNSVKYILQNTYNWQYNNAGYTTAAKYMFNYLLGNSHRRGWVSFHDKTVDSADYELFNRLVMHYSSSEQEALTFLRSVDFTYEDENYNVYPRLVK